MKGISRALFAVALLTLVPHTPAMAQTDSVRVRIMPPPKAQFLQFQRFDVRVEATAPEGATITEVRVTLDGRDVTSLGTVDSPSANVRSWTFRNMYLGVPGERVFAATATATSGSASIGGGAVNRIGVRQWSSSFNTLGKTSSANAVDLMNELHVGAVAAPFHKVGTDNLDEGRARARNVILLIGDGMGAAHRTAARVMSKGYTGGKANGTLAMDRLPFNGLLMTSSLDSLITDSAPGAHNYSTGNKTNNGMEGVFPDNTASEDDNPRIENLPEWIHRNFGMVTGVVSDAYITDATPAAMVAHTQNRGNGTLIASQFIDNADRNGLKVLMGGGAYHFIPKSQTGSRRSDERNVIADFQSAGFTYVDDRTGLQAYQPGSDGKLLGLFHLDNMNVAFDKLGKGDSSVTSAFPDQPFLVDMTKKAIDVLKQYPNGFFLMVEAAHIDKQAHAMDAERSIFDVIQLDHAVEAALEFAIATNSDSDPTNDTLVIVSADHECAGVALPGVGNPEHKGNPRDYVKAYNYGAPRNDTSTFNFTDYVDENGDGYPDNPDADRKLIVNFGANSDRYEDWMSAATPKAPSARLNGVAVANENDPDKAGGMMIPGVVENGSGGGDSQTSAVHTLSDIPISAYGPGASQFARVSDNTEAFFYIVNSIVGQYPVPTQY